MKINVVLEFNNKDVCNYYAKRMNIPNGTKVKVIDAIYYVTKSISTISQPTFKYDEDEYYIIDNPIEFDLFHEEYCKDCPEYNYCMEQKESFCREGCPRRCEACGTRCNNACE